ncbi:MAG: SIMPL domain-containing protein [Bacillota bacterium]|nr:SIMPL domain-containing protein [Bacillota bacterium]
MKKFKEKLLMVVLIAVAAGLILTGCSTPASGNEIRIIGEEVKNNVITVSGLGEIKIKPDAAYITVGVTTQSTSAKKAESSNSDKMNALFAAVKALGISEDDIKTVSYGLYPNYYYPALKPRNYTATNMVMITVKDIAKTGEIMDAAVDAGGNELSSVTFDLLDKTEAYAQALAAAVNDAKAKVDVIAEAAGITEYEPLNITESSYNALPIYYDRNYSLKDEGASTPIATGQLTITANISAEYEIVK